MNKRILAGLVLILLLVVSVSIASADETTADGEYVWNSDHKYPFDFKFLNMIDSHQQSFTFKDGDRLSGYIYIHVIGETEDGFPIAEKAHCKDQVCTVGWIVKGVKVTATLVQKAPRKWLVNEQDLPKEPGYTHFHWLGDPKSPHELQVGDVKEGYLMKRIAPAPFFWLGGPGSGGSGGGGGGCGGHEPGDPGGCEDEGGCTHAVTTTMVTNAESGCTDGHDDGGCSDDGGCTDDHDDGGCSGGGGPGGSHGGSEGRLVLEGVDSHSNIVTSEDQLGHGGGCHD